MTGAALFFAAHLREVRAPQFLLPLLVDEEFFERGDVHELQAVDLMASHKTAASKARHVVDGYVALACGVARAHVHHTRDDNCSGGHEEDDWAAQAAVSSSASIAASLTHATRRLRVCVLRPPVFPTVKSTTDLSTGRLGGSVSVK
jgi:hypothetical protein